MAFLAGLLTGSLAFWKPLAGEILEPAIQFMKSVPVASFVILALIWTGAENLSVFISFLVVYPVIHINTLAGLSHADPGLLEMARVFRIPVWRQGPFHLPDLPVSIPGKRPEDLPGHGL